MFLVWELCAVSLLGKLWPWQWPRHLPCLVLLSLWFEEACLPACAGSTESALSVQQRISSSAQLEVEVRTREPGWLVASSWWWTRSLERASFSYKCPWGSWENGLNSFALWAHGSMGVTGKSTCAIELLVGPAVCLDQDPFFTWDAWWKDAPALQG